MDPNFDGAYIQLDYAYAAKGMYREAITAYEKAAQLGAGFNTKIYLAAAYAGAGERDRARSMLRQFEEGKGYVSPAELAVLYVALGERERALASLEKAYAERDLQLKYLTTEPAYDPITNESRFRELVRKVGLPVS